MKSLTLIFIHNVISSILIFLKLEEVISWSWWIVTAPIWGVTCLLVGVFGIFIIWGILRGLIRGQITPPHRAYFKASQKQPIPSYSVLLLYPQLSNLPHPLTAWRQYPISCPLWPSCPSTYNSNISPDMPQIVVCFCGTINTSNCYNC